MRRLGLASAALLLLPACHSAPTPIEPTGQPKVTPVRSTPATAQATPPKLPAIAKRNDATGAANFVIYWVAVSNYASLSGDTHMLRTISARSCAACSSYIELYEKTYNDGGSIRGGIDRVDHVSVQKGTDEYFVKTRTISGEGAFTPSKTSKPQATPAEALTVVYAAQRTAAGWQMTQIGLNK